MDSARSRRTITFRVFQQSKSGSASQGYKRDRRVKTIVWSLSNRCTTADGRISQLPVVFDHNLVRRPPDIRLLRCSTNNRQYWAAVRGKSAEINYGDVFHSFGSNAAQTIKHQFKLSQCPNSGELDVSVLLGNGDGTFQPKVDFPAPEAPWRISAADFDGDGNLDLATANAGLSGDGTTMSVLLGDGQGGFAPAVNYHTDNDPHTVAVGDFDLNGRPDLAVTASLSDTVAIFLNSPESPAPPCGSPTPTPTPTATATATPSPTATATPTSTPRPTPTPRTAPTPRSRPTPAPRP